MLHKKIDFLRRIQSIKNSFGQYDPYSPYGYAYGYPNGQYGTYGGYDSYSNRYNGLYPTYNSYSTSHPDYTQQQIIQNRLSKRDTSRRSANKNYDLLTNMND